LDAQRGTLRSAGEEMLWRRVETGDPETPRILEALALGGLYTNRLGEAMACLERWLAHSPGDSQALYLRGLAWAGLGARGKAGEGDGGRAARGGGWGSTCWPPGHSTKRPGCSSSCWHESPTMSPFGWAWRVAGAPRGRPRKPSACWRSCSPATPLRCLPWSS